MRPATFRLTLLSAISLLVCLSLGQAAPPSEPLELGTFDSETNSSLAESKDLSALQRVARPSAELNIVKLLPDTRRPRIYAINQDGKEAGSIVVIDAQSHQVIKSIPVGKEPSDIDLTENAAGLLVMNTSDPSIMLVDLETLQITETWPLSEFSNRNEDFGGHVDDGPGDVIYYVDEQWGPRLHVFNTVTKTVLQTFGSENGNTPNTSNDFGYGDIVVSPDASFLFGWRQYGDGAGVGGTHIVKFAIQADGTLADFERGTNVSASNFTREPFDTPALMTVDGSRLVIKDRVIDQGDLDVHPVIYPDEIHSLSPFGEVVCTPSGIYPGQGGDRIHAFSSSMRVQAITPDYAWHVGFDSTTGQLRWLNLIGTVGADALGLGFFPTDGGTVVQPSQLRWLPVAGIREYQVYLGQSRATVDAATPDSPEFLGQTSNIHFDLAKLLNQGTSYFWKVIPIQSDGSPDQGITRSFLVSPLTLSRNAIETATVAGFAHHTESLQIGAASPTAWSASSDAPWISFAENSGTTPSTLTAVIDASQLNPGIHSGDIEITSGGVSFMVPVDVRIHPLNYTLAEADLELDRIYAISQESTDSSQPSYLLVIGSESGEIESALPVGNSVTDLAIHYRENRLYITNWRTGILRALDRDTFDEVQSYQFAPFGGVGYSSGDVYRVAAGSDGRIIFEPEDQWVNIEIVDTADGTILATQHTREGGGAFDPTGRYYYHGENNISNASLHKFDTEGDAFAQVADAHVTNYSYYGSRRVLLSGDGSRVFWNGGIFDPDLNILLLLDDEVVSSTLHGDLVFTDDTIYNGINGESLGSLPLTTTIQAVSSSQEFLYLFKGDSFTIVDLSSIADLPGRGLTPGIADGATVIGTDQTLSWTLEPFAISYDLYFGTDRAAVAAATPDSGEFLGNLVGNTWTGGLPALALDGEYFWRVDVHGFSGSNAGDVWVFDIAPIDVAPREISLSFPAGVPIAPISLALSAAAPTAWTAATDTPWIALNSNAGATDGNLGLQLDSTGLTIGTHQGSVTFTSGSDTWQLPVALEIIALNYTLAAADLELPRIYAISQESTNGTKPAHLLVIDTTTDTVIQAVPIGSSVTDLAVHYRENRIYVTNWKTGVLRALDRDTLEEVQTYPFPHTGFSRHDTDAYRISPGKAGRLIVEGQNQSIQLTLLDTATGEILSRMDSYAGDGVADSTGTLYYHARGTSASDSFVKFDISNDTFERLVSATAPSGPTIIAPDGTLVTSRNKVFDADLNQLHQLSSTVRAFTLHGELMFTDDTVYNGRNGLKLADLPVSASIQAVSLDQDKLFLFKGDVFTTVDLTEIAELPPRGITPMIADGATVIGTDQTLGWTIEPFATSYDLYFGADRAAVANAAPGSAEHLGNLVGSSWPGALPFALDGEYYWRVDINGFNGTQPGDVWSFDIAPIDITPREIVLAFPANAPIPTQTVELSAPSATAWSVATATPWITLGSTFGNTDAPLAFGLDSAGLAPGLHQGAIAFTSGSDTWELPVTLGVIELNITVMKPDAVRPDTLYAINYADPDTHFCHLLRIDAPSGRITDAIEIGRDATDFDIDSATDRLYVANWGFPVTQVVDLATFATLPPIALDKNVYRIEADARGHLFTLSKSYGSVVVWDINSLTKSSLAVSLGSGDIEIDSGGDFLYHGSDSYSARVTKVGLAADPVFVAARSIVLSGGGNGRLMLSSDSSKVVLGSNVFDSNMWLLGTLAGSASSVSPGGELVAGEGKVWWSDGGAPVFTLPVGADVSAFSGGGGHLVIFDSDVPSLRSILVSDIAELPGPWPRPGQILAESPAGFAWPDVAGALSYTLVLDGGPDGTRTFTGITGITGTSFTLPEPLPFGRNYVWRVDAETAEGTRRGPNRRFSVLFPEGPPITGAGGSNVGRAVAIGPDTLLIGGDGAAFLNSFDPVTGASSPFQTLSIDGRSSNHNFGTPVVIDGSAAFVSAYKEDIGADNAGTFHAYSPDHRGFYRDRGTITAPSPVANERFGNGLAASGNVLLAGTGTTSTSMQGRVIAYLTQPSVIQTQVIQPSDSEPGDGFGQTIAMHGDTAVVAAPGRGASYSRLANVYVFTRDSATGQWTQAQELALTGVQSYGNAASSLAVSDSAIAVNDPSQDLVHLFTRKSNGTWQAARPIAADDVDGADNYTAFATSVAFHGDLLFVGDTNARFNGIAGGVVFTFRRSGSRWIQGPTLVPDDLGRSSFGKSLAIRDGWLLVGGSGQSWIFRIDVTTNHTPVFVSSPPFQAVSGRSLEFEVRAEDLDGNDNLAIDAPHLPAWLGLTDNGGGSATLAGTPSEPSGSTFDVQLRVTDPAGASSLQNFRLTLLSESDVPVITAHPAAVDLGVGQELILRGAVEGIGPFIWQWQRDGIDIPGANQPTLIIPEVQLDDTGSYTFTVANVIATVTSNPAAVTVHPANRFAGPWPTFGGSPRHAGMHPATLARHRFAPAWETLIDSPYGTVQRPAIAEGKVFVTPYVYFGGTRNAIALDLTSGETLWTHPFEDAYSINPPTYHNNRIYIQRGNHSSDTHLWCLDAESGETVWSAPHSAQWERYEAPAVTDDGIWVNGGSSGGMYGFAPDGTQLFFRSLAQVSGWTPAVSNGRLFTSLGNSFTEHNPIDGTVLWSVTTEFSGTSIPIISGNRAVVGKGGGLACIDLDERMVAWEFGASLSGSRPAIAGGMVYALDDALVRTYSLATGDPGPVFDSGTGSALRSGQPLVLNDHLLVATNDQTFVFDLASGDLVQTLEGGGKLAYSDGYLLAAGTDGTLRAYFANAAPEFTDAMPPEINSGDAANDLVLPLAPYAADPDPGDPLSWAIVSVSNPVIFQTLNINPDSGDLSVIYNPWQYGMSEVVISITDFAGNVTETSITFTVPDHPLPQLDLTENLVLNRQTGLYEHTITVTNSGAREIAGFDLSITGLPDGVIIQNASKQVPGGGTIHHRQTLAAGASITLILEYHTPLRGTVLKPKTRVSIVTEPEFDPAAKDQGIAVDRCILLHDGGLLIEFTSIPGGHYEIQYSDDAVHWKVSPVEIRAAGNRVQWIDRGPPRTDSKPASKSSRFYRVRELSSH